MLSDWVRCTVLCMGMFGLTSCGGQRPGLKIDRVAVVPVQGSVTVDGQPAAGVKVRCIPTGNFEAKDVVNALGGTTDEEGNFTLGTYEIADGVPPAEYALTFVWPIVSLKKQSRADEAKSDRLKGKYATKETAPIKFKVEEGEPVVLDLIDLKTK